MSGDKDQVLNNKKKGKPKCAEVDLVTQLKVLHFCNIFVKGCWLGLNCPFLRLKQADCSFSISYFDLNQG